MPLTGLFCDTSDQLKSTETKEAKTEQGRKRNNNTKNVDATLNVDAGAVYTRLHAVYTESVDNERLAKNVDT